MVRHKLKAPKTYDELKIEWYDKLKNCGFEDIEQPDGMLKRWSSSVFNDRRLGYTYEERRAYYDSVAEYYRLAGQLLHTYKFSNGLERLVWKLHCEGRGQNHIIAECRDKGHNIYSNRITKVLRKLRKVMLTHDPEQERFDND